MGKGRPFVHGTARGGARRVTAAVTRAGARRHPIPCPTTSAGTSAAGCSTSDDSSPDKSRSLCTRGIRRYYRRKNVARCVIRKRIFQRGRESDSEREDDSSEPDTICEPSLGFELSHRLPPLQEYSTHDLSQTEGYYGRTNWIISPRASKRRRRSLDKQWVAGGESCPSANATPESLATSEDEDFALVWEDTSDGDISQGDNSGTSLEVADNKRTLVSRTKEEIVKEDRELSNEEYGTPSEDEPSSQESQHSRVKLVLQENERSKNDEEGMSTACNSLQNVEGNAPQDTLADKPMPDRAPNLKNEEKIEDKIDDVSEQMFSLEDIFAESKSQKDTKERKEQQEEVFAKAEEGARIHGDVNKSKKAEGSVMPNGEVKKNRQVVGGVTNDGEYKDSREVQGVNNNWNDKESENAVGGASNDGEVKGSGKWKSEECKRNNIKVEESGKAVEGARKGEVEDSTNPDEIVIKYEANIPEEEVESAVNIEMDDLDRYTRGSTLRNIEMNHISGDHTMESTIRNAVRQPVPPPTRGRLWQLGRPMSRREAALLRGEAFVRREAATVRRQHNLTSRRESNPQEEWQAELERRVLGVRMQDVIDTSCPTSPPTIQPEILPPHASSEPPHANLKLPFTRRIITPPSHRHLEAPKTRKRPMTEPCHKKADVTEKQTERAKSGSSEAERRYGSRPSSRDSVPITSILPPRRQMETDSSVGEMHYPMLQNQMPFSGAIFSEQGNQLLFGSRGLLRAPAPVQLKTEATRKISPILGRRPGNSAIPFTAALTPLRHAFSPLMSLGPRTRDPMFGGCMRAMASLGHRSLQTAFTVGNTMMLVGPRDIDTTILMRGVTMTPAPLYRFGSPNMCLPLVNDINHVHVAHGDVQPEIVEIHTNPNFTDRPSLREPNASDIQCSIVEEKEASLILDTTNDAFAINKEVCSWREHTFILHEEAKSQVKEEKTVSKKVYCKQCNKGKNNQNSKKSQAVIATKIIKAPHTTNDNPRKKRERKVMKESNQVMKNVGTEKKETSSIGTVTSGDIHCELSNQKEINKNALEQKVSSTSKKTRMTDDKCTSTSLPSSPVTTNPETDSSMKSEPSTETTDSQEIRPSTPPSSPINAVVPISKLEKDLSTFCTPLSLNTPISIPATPISKPNSPEKNPVASPKLFKSSDDDITQSSDATMISSELTSPSVVENEEPNKNNPTSETFPVIFESASNLIDANGKHDSQEDIRSNKKDDSSESHESKDKIAELASDENQTLEKKLVQENGSQLSYFSAIAQRDSMIKANSQNEQAEMEAKESNSNVKNELEREASVIAENIILELNAMSKPSNLQNQTSPIKRTEDLFYSPVVSDVAESLSVLPPPDERSESRDPSTDRSDPGIEVTPIRVCITPLEKAEEIPSDTLPPLKKPRKVSTKARTQSLSNVDSPKPEKNSGDEKRPVTVAHKQRTRGCNSPKARVKSDAKSRTDKKKGKKCVASPTEKPCETIPESDPTVSRDAEEEATYSGPVRSLLFVKCAPLSPLSPQVVSADKERTVEVRLDIERSTLQGRKSNVKVLNKKRKGSVASEKDKKQFPILVNDLSSTSSSSSSSSLSSTDNFNNVLDMKEFEKTKNQVEVKQVVEEQPFGTPPKHIGRLYFTKACNTREIGLVKSKTEPDIAKSLNESAKEPNNKGKNVLQNLMSSDSKKSEIKTQKDCLKNPIIVTSKSQKEISRNRTQPKGSDNMPKEPKKLPADSSKGQNGIPTTEKIVELAQKISKDNQKKQKDTVPVKSQKEILRDQKHISMFINDICKNQNIFQLKSQNEITKSLRDNVKTNKEVTKEQKGNTVTKFNKESKKSQKEVQNVLEQLNKARESLKINNKDTSKSDEHSNKPKDSLKISDIFRTVAQEPNKPKDILKNHDTEASKKAEQVNKLKVTFKTSDKDNKKNVVEERNMPKETLKTIYKESSKKVEQTSKLKDTFKTNDKDTSKTFEKEVTKTIPKYSKSNENPMNQIEVTGVRTKNQNIPNDRKENNKDLTKPNELVNAKNQNLAEGKRNIHVNKCPIKVKDAIRKMFLPRTENEIDTEENNVETEEEQLIAMIGSNDYLTRTEPSGSRNTQQVANPSKQTPSKNKVNFEFGPNVETKPKNESISAMKIEKVKLGVTEKPPFSSSIRLLWKEETSYDKYASQERKRVRFFDDEATPSWEGFVNEWVRDVNERMSMNNDKWKRKDVSNRLKQNASTNENSENEEIELSTENHLHDIQMSTKQISSASTADNMTGDIANEVASILKKRESSQTLPESRRKAKTKRGVKNDPRPSSSEDNRKDVRKSESASLPVSRSRGRGDSLSSQTEGSLKGSSAKKESSLAGKDGSISVPEKHVAEPNQKSDGKKKSALRTQISISNEKCNQQNSPQMNEVEGTNPDIAAKGADSRKLCVKSATSNRTTGKEGTEQKRHPTNVKKSVEKELETKKRNDEASCSNEESSPSIENAPPGKGIRAKKRNASAEIECVNTVINPIGDETSQKKNKKTVRIVTRQKALMDSPSESFSTKCDASQNVAKKKNARKKKGILVQNEDSVPSICSDVSTLSAKSFKERVKCLPEWKGVIPGGVDPFPGFKYRLSQMRRKSPVDRRGHGRSISLKVRPRGLNVTVFGQKLPNHASNDVSRRASSLSSTSHGSSGSTLEARGIRTSSRSLGGETPLASDSSKRPRKIRKYSMGRRKAVAGRGVDPEGSRETIEGLPPPRRLRSRKRSTPPTWM